MQLIEEWARCRCSLQCLYAQQPSEDHESHNKGSVFYNDGFQVRIKTESDEQKQLSKTEITQGLELQGRLSKTIMAIVDHYALESQNNAMDCQGTDCLRQDGMTALKLACKYGWIELVNKIIDADTPLWTGMDDGAQGGACAEDDTIMTIRTLHGRVPFLQEETSWKPDSQCAVIWLYKCGEAYERLDQGGVNMNELMTRIVQKMCEQIAKAEHIDGNVEGLPTMKTLIKQIALLEAHDVARVGDEVVRKSSVETLEKLRLIVEGQNTARLILQTFI